MAFTKEQTQSKPLTPTRIKRLQQQGVSCATPSAYNELKWGIRFAYILCTSLVALGVIIQDIYLLSVMTLVAFGGMVLNNHPFDYLYNQIIAPISHKPKVPPRPPQLKFACGIATFCLLTTTYLFYIGHSFAASIFGAGLIGVGSLVSLTDICIPSLIYNALFLRKDA